MIHTAKGFSIVSEAEVDVSLEFSCFFYNPMDVGNLISGSSAFSKPSLNICKFSVHVLLKSSLKNFEYYFAKAMAPHSSTLAWKIPWMEEHDRLQSMGPWRVGHDWATSLSLSHASKVMLKILQARFQEYGTWELPDVQAGFRKSRGTRDQIANIHWIMEKARKFQKNIYFCLIGYAKVLIVWITKKLENP